MFSRKPTMLLLTLQLCATLSGCVDDHALLAQVHEYFPGASLYKFDKRVLWIQTEVDGITPKLGEQIFLRFLDEANSAARHRSWGIVSLSSAMKQDGYIYLVLGFKQGIVAWDRRNGISPTGSERPHHWNLTWEQAPAWLLQHLGYCPKDNQIVIVRE
jgi:hypothetical protein